MPLTPPLHSFLKPFLFSSCFIGTSLLAQAQCSSKLDDFEANRKVTYTQTDGVLTQNSPNPGTNTVNGSTLCAKYQTKASTAYDNLVGIAPIGNGNDYKTGKKLFKIDVYSALPNTPIALILSNNKLATTSAYPTGRHSVYNATTTKTNQWETLTFVYAATLDASVPGDSTNQINLQFASGINTGATFYFDNLVSSADVAVNAGANQTFCNTASVVPVNGTITDAPGGIWSSPTGGTFSPNANSLKASYHLTPADISNGGVTLTLSTVGAACGTVTSPTLITLNTCAGLTLSIPSYTFCAGDSFKVNYSSNSATFTSGNYFIVQLSNSTGSFTSSTVLGSLNSTNAEGSILCKIPDQPTVSSKYRMRVIATAPSTTGLDNGADITIGDIAYPIFQYSSTTGTSSPVAIGDTITLNSTTYNATSCSWQSDVSATFKLPVSCTEKVVYKTAGTKTILLKAMDINGCSDTISKKVQVYSCHPVIPANAKVVTGTVKGGFPNGASIWVKNGGSFSTDPSGANQTIYVSTGGSVFIAGGYNFTIYLELLASCDGKAATAGGDVIVYDPNALLSNILGGDFKVPCSGLTLQNEVVTSLVSLEETSLRGPLVFPNPATDGKFSVTSSDPILEITATNSWGQKQTLVGSTSFETDLKGLLLLHIKTEKGTYVQKLNVLK